MSGFDVAENETVTMNNLMVVSREVQSSQRVSPLIVLKRIEPVVLVAGDILATYIAIYVAAWGRASWPQVTSFLGPLVTTGLLAAVNIVVFAVFHMYDSLWRYASISEAIRILAASVCASFLTSGILRVFFNGGLSLREYGTAWAVMLILVAGSRMTIRTVLGGGSLRLLPSEGRGQPRTLIVGAGQTGSLTIKRMLSGDKDVAGSPVAVVDDDPTKMGQRVHGVKVKGNCADIVRVAQECSIDQIVIAVPSATAAQKKRILDTCIETGLRVLTLPNVRDMPLDGKRRLVFQEVDVKDLLGREETLLDLGKMGYITDKTVLVTGGGGSIGAELVRQLLPANPRKIVIFDIYENTAYELLHELRSSPRKVGTEVVVEIGSVTDLIALQDCFTRHNPDVVFHAAAHKHVPLMEHNPREAVYNNVFGTRNVAQFAISFKCSHFVLISTDKAVNPTNVMGATKRMCEMVIQSMAHRSPTVFAAVRFGNVLGSHGSVVPLFQRQLKQGGPITLTHEDIARYFMTIPEAARLVITAGALASGGEIYVLNMGEPVKIYDLAVNLIKLSGLKVERDIEIAITGLRPGEKLYEELSMASESVRSTEDQKISIAIGTPPSPEVTEQHLRSLLTALDSGQEKLIEELMNAVPTFRPKNISRKL